MKHSDFRILWLPAIFCLLLIVIEFHLLTTDRYFSKTKESAHGDAIATYVSGKNRVRKKTVGTLVWEQPSEQMPLYREDAIATMEDSEAVVAFSDHSELIVEPNSLVILEQAPEGTAPGQKIVARLVKGSIKRKSTGAMPFFIKLSKAKDAKPVEFDDTEGHSVFRVIYKIEGYDVVVENGAVAVNGKTVMPTQKLKAPKLNKPKIEIYEQKEQKAEGAWLWNWLVTSAVAAEPKKIRIHFSWEPIEDAQSYRVQVSKSPEFTSILKESDVTAAEYEFLLSAPESKDEMFFRVAGIARNGEVGEYSSVEKVEVNPVPVEMPVIAKKVEPSKPIEPPKPVATPKPEPTAAAVVKKPAEPAPVVVAKQEFHIPEPSAPIHVWLGYGMIYDNRKFKNTEVNPREASGGGIVPAQLSLELRKSADNQSFFSLGGYYTFEQASPDLPPPSDTAFSVGPARAWLSYGRSFSTEHTYWIYQLGPYVASTKQVTVSGLDFSVQTKWMIGAMFSLQNDLEQMLKEQGFGWKFQAGVLIAGALGVDVSAALRKALFRTGDLDGLFGGVEVSTRQTKLESGYGAALQVGWWH